MHGIEIIGFYLSNPSLLVGPNKGGLKVAEGSLRSDKQEKSGEDINLDDLTSDNHFTI